MNRGEFDNRTWGALALRGVLAIGFGILAFSRPGQTVTALVYLFAVYAFLDGIAAIAASVNVAQLGGRWVGLFLAGMAGVVIGVLAFLRPSVTALGMIYYLSGWAVITGVLEIVAAVRLRKVIENEWMLAAAGVLSIAFGFLIAARPAAGMQGVVWMIGAYAIVFGGLMLGLASRLRSAERKIVTP